MEYRVYVKTDDAGFLTAVHSSAFLTDTAGWVEIDSGRGDQYHHAQGNYFPKPIVTEGGAYRYKLVGGAPVECTAEEIARQEAANAPAPESTQEERIAVLEEQNTMLLDCLLEMSEIIYA